jgi:hypothetical protein
MATDKGDQVIGQPGSGEEDSLLMGLDPGDGVEEEALGGEKALEEEAPKDRETPEEEAATGDKPKETVSEAGLDPRLKQAARRARLSDGQVEALGDAAVPVLRQLADEFDQITAEYSKVGQAMEDLRGPAPGKAAPRAAAVPQGTATEQEDPLAQPFSLKLDADVYGEDFAKALAPVEPYVNALAQRLQAMEQVAADREMEAIGREIDGFFGSDALTKDFGSMFGEGQTEGLGQHTPEYLARQAVIQEADAIAAGAASQGRRMTVDQALHRAVSIVTGRQSYQAARKDIEAKLRQRAGQAVQRPTHRQTQAKFDSPQAKAAAAYQRRAAELDVNTELGADD